MTFVVGVYGLYSWIVGCGLQLACTMFLVVFDCTLVFVWGWVCFDFACIIICFVGYYVFGI